MLLLRGLAAFCTLLLFPVLSFADVLHARNSTGLTSAVTWDSHSLSILGQRTFVLSAEFHPWRLPNPALWADVFQKIKASGFNTVSFYVNWALHYPAPDTNGGEGDFTEGTYRDLQRFIDDAKSSGLWLIARPGPYINAETTGGGFPGWVGNIAGSLRTNNPNYTQAWTPYMTRIARLLAQNQITNGGPVILVQAENEYSAGLTHNSYMQAIIDLYRAEGIVVPITFNDQHSGQTGNFSPDRTPPGQGAVDIYCGDSYPQGTSSWSQVQTIYYSAHKAVAPSNPLCLAEFGGGYLLGWGGGVRGPTGYERYETDLTNAQYEDVFYKENYAQTTTILNIYMTFGGTNWGNTLEPTVYTSYDYGAGINENRVATPKMNEMRLQGLFLRRAPDLLGANYIANGTNYTTSTALHTAELRNLETGAGFYFVRHADSRSTALTTAQLNVTTSRGALAIPQNESLTVDGRDYKVLLTDYVFGASARTMLYTTAEVMTWTTIDGADYIALYTGLGQTGEVALVFSAEPIVSVTPGLGNISSSYSSGLLTLSFAPVGLAIANITGADGKNVMLLAMDKSTVTTWHAPLIAGSGTFGAYFGTGTNETVLVGGPYLVRTAEISGNTLYLTGDLNGTTPVEFFASRHVVNLNWNGKSQHATRMPRGSYAATVSSPSSVALPTLGGWKVLGSLPELTPSFDDSDWTSASITATNYTNFPPLTRPWVLYAQQYGVYGGQLLWRGHFNATGAETAFNLTVIGGYAFAYSAWLNGVYIGSGQGSSTVGQLIDLWAFPQSALRPGQDNILTVLQDHMGIVETSTNSGKEPRGIRGYDIVGGNTTFNHWKYQGNLGGAAGAPDTFRGYLNEGGLYAERIGAHLPGFPDGAWEIGAPTDGTVGPGVNFYRTTFALSLPTDADVPVRLRLVSNDTGRAFRVQVYLNGWMLGKYINNLGPQTDFVLPAGILKQHSDNTLALALWSLEMTGAALNNVLLVTDGTFGSALAVEDWNAAPNYAAQKAKREPAATVVPPM